MLVKEGSVPSKGALTISIKWKKGLGSSNITEDLAGKREGIQIIGVT